MNIELNFVPSSLKKKRDIDITNLSCDEYKQKFRSSCNDLTSCNQTALQAFIYDYTQRNVLVFSKQLKVLIFFYFKATKSVYTYK